MSAKRYNPVVSKPILDVVLITREGLHARARAVLDSGSFFTIVRADVLPPTALVGQYKRPKVFKTARRGGKMRVTGEIILAIAIAGKEIRAASYVSQDLGREMLIGAGAMQEWDISIVNKNGSTRVVVGRDLNDPELTAIE